MPKGTPLSRIMQYCAVAERSRFDVRKKLMEWDVEETRIEEILESLLREGFISDSRYAQAYASDQWRFQQWGRLKIRQALMVKLIPSGEIEKALDLLPSEAYHRMILQELEKKWKDLGRTKGVVVGQKVLAFARQRGYEDDFIFPWLEEKRLLNNE